uniref:uncharacterized protein isoform X3 n=1 Tax=Myxine glutinosa TaxID=7769 RepID=UPI00358DE050
MKPKGHREMRFCGSLQGYLRLLLIQIIVFFAASCAQTSEDSSPSSSTSAVTYMGTETTVVESTSSVFTGENGVHPTSTTVPCGGNLPAEGWLSSPEIMYSNMECVWDIEAPLGHVVLLTVVDLNSYDYSSPSQCYGNWLAVAYTQTSDRDVTMCHDSDVGRTFISPSNTLRVFYNKTSDYEAIRFNVTLSSQDGCIPAQLKVVSYNLTSVSITWIVPNDLNNTHLSFVSLFSSGKEIQNHTTKYKEITITGLSPFTEYNVSISSMCNGTESIPARIAVHTGPSPPMNLTVVEQGIGFATLRWTAPNDPNKDSYRYDVIWYQNGFLNYKAKFNPEINITSLSPETNYTVNVTSSYNNKDSLPATITFTAVPCGGNLPAEGWLSSPEIMYSTMECVWDIEAPLGHVVLLTVVDLNSYYYLSESSPSRLDSYDYSSPSQCYWSWLAVAYTQTSDRDVTMCHDSDVGRTFISPSNTLRLFYSKTFDFEAIRFNVTLSSQDIDECTTQKVCGNHSICRNVIGSYNCSCERGYEGSPCMDVDECNGNNDCHSNATCSNTDGGHNCTCKEGFTGNGLVCIDIDECESSSTNNCDPNSTLCVNVIGNYLCRCRTGYENVSAGKCQDINECDNSTVCVNNADCLNLNGTYNCTCREGFVGNGDISCQDIDECSTQKVCGNHSICLNVIGSYNCSCERGYEGDPCMDVDECDGNNDCHSNATCSNTDGGHNCTCKEGFTGNGLVCIDVDECESSSTNNCDPNITLCVNVIGNYLCRCRTGYENVSAGKCQDINECDNSTACVKNAECINLNGTYNCICREGFVGNGDISCQDIDECTTQKVCGNHSICLNVIGSHNCSCERGYEGDPCVDVDECNGNNDCHSNATCSNTDGGHNCTCKEGFTGNGLVCIDVDECESSSTNECDPNTTLCVNVIGNYLCRCRTGYENVSAGKCQDIDECKPGTLLCNGKNETCTNTIGLYKCDCEDGYDRINSSCVGETTISTPDTTSQPGSSATTHSQVVATISTTTGLIKMKVNLKMTATNENYLQEMQNKNSTTYKEFVTKFEYEIIQSLKGVSSNFSKLVILNLTYHSFSSFQNRHSLEVKDPFV